jgi:activating signal cointegrator complex subunit 3
LYQTNKNILIGAPTGSGKTIMSELAILNLFKTSPEKKCVYIAPLKSLVK